MLVCAAQHLSQHRMKAVMYELCWGGPSSGVFFENLSRIYVTVMGVAVNSHKD